MRITDDKRTQLNRLRVLLQEACHAPGCKRLKNCPRQCGCRTRRTFKLNTDTAMCWEIAALLFTLRRCTIVTKTEIKEISDKIRAYAEVTRHHSTKGWQKFFWTVKETYDFITTGDPWWDNQADHSIAGLKGRMNRLKRYPRS